MTNTTERMRDLLDQFRRVVWNSGWNSPSDEALESTLAELSSEVKGELNGKHTTS